MDFIQEFLKSKGPALAGSLVSKLGFSQDQASGFLSGATKSIIGLVAGGKIDLGSLLGGGGVSSLLSKLDLVVLAGSVGIENDKAQAGVEEVGPSVISALQEKSDNPEELLSMLGGGEGGIGDSVSNVAKGLFGK